MARCHGFLGWTGCIREGRSIGRAAKFQLSFQHLNWADSFYTRSFHFFQCLSRRKFRSQTSNNMGRSNNRGESSHRRERVTREELRRERVSRKKIQVEEKVEQSRKIVFFQCINVAWLQGVKSRLAKAAGAEPSCQIGDQQLHAPLARSIFGSQNVDTSLSDFWEVIILLGYPDHVCTKPHRTDILLR